jgi:hypothetical protein
MTLNNKAHSHAESLREYPGPALERISLYVASIVVVIKTDDIVLAQILTALNLYDHQRDFSGILQPVVLANGDKGGLVDIDHLLQVSAGHQSGTGHNNPVFAAMMMLLQRETLTGQYLNALDLVTAAFIKHQI